MRRDRVKGEKAGELPRASAVRSASRHLAGSLATLTLSDSVRHPGGGSPRMRANRLGHSLLEHSI